MPVKTAEERSERSRIAAHVTLSRHDPHKLTEAARAAKWASYERQVDPHGELAAEERHRRARHAMRAELARINLRRLQAQREAQQAGDRDLAQQLVDAVLGGSVNAG